MMATILLLICCLSVARGAFDEVPVSQKVSVGAEAEFRCRHPTADFIRWRVNGLLVGRNPPPDITRGTTRDDSDNLVDTLTITAQPEYNGTVVVCVARFDDGSPTEETYPAELIVLKNASAVEDRFVLSPVSLNVTLDTEALFQCQHLNAHGINWRINRSILTDFPHGISTDRIGGSVYTLIITALPNYNHTVIECVAFFVDSPSEVSSAAVMMVQGNLDSVTDVVRSSSSISWTPPFSLDLTGVDPDIIYCVEVYNITCGKRDLIIGDCSVTETSYTSDNIMDGYIYEYIVTPRSNVSEPKNGTSSPPLRDQFFSYSVNSPHLMAEDSSLMYIYEAELTYNTISNRQMPSTCTLSLKSQDGLGDYDETIACNSNSNPINLEIFPKRLWKCLVLANGCPYNSVLVEEPELSTHDVQNISVSSPHAGSIMVGGNFIPGSTAIGVLIIITSNSTNDTQYHLCRRNGNNMQVEDTISGLTGGHHKVSAFVFEESEYLVNRTATIPKSISVMNGGESAPSSTILYHLCSNSTHVCVTCMFTTSSPTSCLAVVHQQISQLSSSGLMNIESSHKFTRSDDTAYGCIETNLTVGVVDGKLVLDVSQEGSSSVCVECHVIAGSVLALVFLVVFISLLIASVLVYRKKKKDRQDDIVLERSVRIMEEDATRVNLYEEIPSSMMDKVDFSTEENTPLMCTRTVESDGQAESNDRQLSSQTPPTSSPPVIPLVAELSEKTVEATKTMYSELDHHSNPGFSAPPPQGDEPQYSTVSKFKNAQDVEYACHVVKPPSSATQPQMLDDSTKTAYQYSELIHHSDCQEKTATTTPTAILSNKPETPTSPFVPSLPAPCTAESLLSLLRSIASKWQSLGEALSLDEDDLDIIDPNNETDEACLQDMLEFYVEKSNSQCTWEKVATALTKIDEKLLAEKIQGLHIEPYENPLPGQTGVVHTEGSPTCNVITEDARPELLLPPREQSESNSSRRHSSGKSPSASSNDCSDSYHTSVDEDEGYVDEGVDRNGTCTRKETMQPTAQGITHTQKEAMQPTAQDVPKKDGIVHVHNSGPKFQPKNLKEPVTFQHLDYDSPEQRMIHSQCEDDVQTTTSAISDSSPNNEIVLNKDQLTVVAPAEKKHHDVTDDENQNVLRQKSSAAVVLADNTLNSDFKDFTFEQDDYYKVSLGTEDDAGNDKKSSHSHHTPSSTIQLSNYEYAFRLRQLADLVNVGERLWQLRAQALSQEGSEHNSSGNAEEEACQSSDTVLNKRLRVDERNKLRINFQRSQKITQ